MFRHKMNLFHVFLDSFRLRHKFSVDCCETLYQYVHQAMIFVASANQPNNKANAQNTLKTYELDIKYNNYLYHFFFSLFLENDETSCPQKILKSQHLTCVSLPCRSPPGSERLFSHPSSFVQSVFGRPVSSVGRTTLPGTVLPETLGSWNLGQGFS